MFDHEALEFKRGNWEREKQGKEVSGGKNERGKKTLDSKQSHSLQNSPIHCKTVLFIIEMNGLFAQTPS